MVRLAFKFLLTRTSSTHTSRSKSRRQQTRSNEQSRDSLSSRSGKARDSRNPLHDPSQVAAFTGGD